MLKWKHPQSLCRAAVLGLALCLVLSTVGLPAGATDTRGQSTTSNYRLAPGEDSLVVYVVGGLAVLALAVGVILYLRKNPKPVVEDPKPTEPEPVVEEPKPTEPEPGLFVPIPGGRPEDLDTIRRREWVLEIINGPQSGLQYPVLPSGLLLGRSEEANIRFPASTRGVSRKHCLVTLNRGELMVTDLGSSQGTYLTGEGRLLPQKAYPLPQGSVLSLGSESVQVKACIRNVP